MGWPDKTPDLSEYFPGHLLETGHDILFFWVARMVMMSLELTDKLPFDTVFLHAMVRDKLGRKMSKSRGNVVDPIHVMEGVSLQTLLDKIKNGNLPASEHKSAMIAQRKDFPKGIPECGADGLRYGLLTYMKQGGSINLDINVVVGCRNFCNKLWQAFKLSSMFFEVSGFKVPAHNSATVISAAEAKEEAKGLSSIDKWILSKLHNAALECKKGFEAFEFAAITTACKQFWYDEFCDYYLEMIKPVLYGADEAAKAAAAQTLYTCVDGGLRLLHPLMPFVTEELYQRLPGRDNAEGSCDSIMIASYPTPEATKRWENKELEEKMSDALSIIVSCTRKLRSIVGLNMEKTELYIKPPADQKSSSSMKIEDFAGVIGTLTYSDKVEFITDESKAPEKSLNEVKSGYTMYLPAGAFKSKMERLVLEYEKKATDATTRCSDIKTRMESQTYIAKTPQNIKDKDTESLKKLSGERDQHHASLEMFLAMMTSDERKALHEKKIQTWSQKLQKASKELEDYNAKIPAKEDKSYKKVMHKLTPKIKKAEMLKRQAGATLEKLQKMEIR